MAIVAHGCHLGRFRADSLAQVAHLAPIIRDGCRLGRFRAGALAQVDHLAPIDKGDPVFGRPRTTSCACTFQNTYRIAQFSCAYTI